VATLRVLKLSGMLDTLEARLAQARGRGARPPGVPPGPLRGRDQPPGGNRPDRRVRAAKFQEVTTLEGFDFSYNPKLPAATIRDLAALSFVDASESVILYGPVGVGKTHVAQAFGHLACRRGFSVTFATCSRVLADLSGGRADGSWEARLRRWGRPRVLILDDFASEPSPLPRQTTSMSWWPSDGAARSSLHRTVPPPTGTGCSPTLSWPRACSTVLSTPPTTWPWSARASAQPAPRPYSGCQPQGGLP